MNSKMIHGVEVTLENEMLSDDEINAYIAYLSEKNRSRNLIKLSINVDGEFVDLHYDLAPIEFDRIRRITGYLVGNLDRFNNAKLAEVNDRVKHEI